MTQEQELKELKSPLIRLDPQVDNLYPLTLPLDELKYTFAHSELSSSLTLLEKARVSNISTSRGDCLAFRRSSEPMLE